MEYEKFYLLSDIPTDFFYTSKEHKNRAMVKKIKRAGIEIVRCKYGYRWIKKSDYYKLKPFLTKPDLKNILLKQEFEKKNPPPKPSIDRVKHYYEIPVFYDKKKIEMIAKDLRIKPRTIIARYRARGWDIDAVFEKPRMTYSKNGEFFKMKLRPIIDDFGEYKGESISEISKKLNVKAGTIYWRIRRGWRVEDAFTKKNTRIKKVLEKK